MDGTQLANVIAGLFQAFAHEKLTCSGAVQGFTAGTMNATNKRKAVRAVVTIEDAPVRYNWDGSVPTASAGHLANAGDVLIVLGYDALANFQIIKQGATTAYAMVTYER
jgi:hypothetical protein